jgi:hypothetical protein
MTTYRTRDGAEYPRYEKFPHHYAGTLTWLPLLIAPNRVRFFEASQLTEVKSPFDSGMVYCYPAEPPVDQHWADVQQARIEWNWKHVFVTPEQYTSVNASVGVRLCVRKPAPVISVYAESMRAA